METRSRFYAGVICVLMLTWTVLQAQITQGFYQSSRLNTHFREGGDPNGETVVFIHGVLASSLFWEPVMVRMPQSFHTFALDMRGFGDSETKLVDATLGMADFSEDVYAFLSEQGYVGGGNKIHLAGWSMGGIIAMKYAVDHPETVHSLLLVDPVPPYGFLATKDEFGTPNYSDFAGSGAGTVDPEFVQRLAAGDTSTASPSSPLNIMRNFYFKPPFRPANEHDLLMEMLKTAVGPGNFPGDFDLSGNWPFVAPGDSGTQNAFSPKYGDVSNALINIPNKFPILWIRGADDLVISDSSFFDLGYLATQGLLPPGLQSTWPGDSIFPAQPMDSQTRYVLGQYAANGGSYSEVVITDAAHSPLVEKPDEVTSHYLAFLSTVGVAPHPLPGAARGFRLEANYPNPFNPGTVIRYEVPRKALVKLEVYNLAGQRIRTLVSQILSAGSYTARFDGKGIPSGVYLYRLQAEGISITRKMVLLK